MRFALFALLLPSALQRREAPRPLHRRKAALLEDDEHSGLKLDAGRVEGRKEKPRLVDCLAVGVGRIDKSFGAAFEKGLEKMSEEHGEVFFARGIARMLIQLAERQAEGLGVGLVGSIEPRGLGQYVTEKIEMDEIFHDSRGGTRSEDLDELLGEPRGTGFGEKARVPLQGPAEAPGNAEPCGSGVFYAADHSDRVFFEDRGEGDDGLDPLGADVLEAPHVVDKGRVVGVVIQSVEREVPAKSILVNSAELVADRAVGYGTESADLEDLRSRIDVDEAEAPAYDAGGAEYPLDARRLSLGDYVEILGPTAEKEIADRAADDVGFVAVLAKALDYAQGICVYGRAINPVLFLGVHDGFSYRLAVGRSAVSNEQ
jgi:hypothetical protein